MTSGYDWPLIAQAVGSLAVIGVLFQLLTIWAFGRLAR